MSRSKKISFVIAAIVFLLSLTGIVARETGVGNQLASGHKKKVKLYWFIPDGLRAEPDLFTLYKWADEGKLPNIKKMMEKGSYGYSIPVFPGHTPSNFATLFTGVLPKEHGVSDGPIRSFGYPLKIISRSGFSSTAKEKDPIWYTLEQNGMNSSLLSVPGSTPPEISEGYIVKGRWGGWGMDFPSVIFHSDKDQKFKELMGLNDRAFNVGKRLTIFTPSKKPEGWSIAMPKTYSEAYEADLKNWGADLFALFLDEKDDGQEQYTTVILSKNKKDILATIHEGEWSDWIKTDFFYEIQKSFQDEHPQKMNWEQEITGVNVASSLRVKVIKLGDRNMFRVRVLYDGLNDSLTYPFQLNAELQKASGPMVDFPDDFPPQLIYFPEDKQTFADENRFSFEWHQKTLKYALEHLSQDVVIQNIYTTNQMLTSRWWMEHADPNSYRYAAATEEEHASAWKDILETYQRVDSMLGEAMAHLDSDAYLVFGSDHGIAPLNEEVRLNNLFAQKGWLKFKRDGEGALRIDWDNTKVVFLQSYHVYVNPAGLGDAYSPPSGEAYEKLLTEVQKALSELKDKNGEQPFMHVLRRDEVEEKMGLPKNRVGDLVLVFREGDCAVEDMSEDLKVFQEPLKSGYKQGLLPAENKALWTPFVIMGPGIKAGYQLPRPISHLDQYPLIMNLLKVPGAPPIKNEDIKKILTD